MASDDNAAYASECVRLAELTVNQALRDDLVDLALLRMAEAERDDYSKCSDVEEGRGDRRDRHLSPRGAAIH
jgi:hypothetical protein